MVALLYLPVAAALLYLLLGCNEVTPRALGRRSPAVVAYATDQKLPMGPHAFSNGPGTSNRGGIEMVQNLVFIDPKPPAELYVHMHQSTAVSCEVGTVYGVIPHITWLKNGQPFHSETTQEDTANTAVIASKTRSILFIDCLSASDAAVYTCVANSTSAVVQTDTVLHVLPDESGSSSCNGSTGRGTDPRFVMWNPSTLQEAGLDVTLYCRVVGCPTPRVTWEFRSGIPERQGQTQFVTNDRKHSILSSGDLVIHDLQFSEDMGTYVCKAQNAHGSGHVEAFVYQTETEN